MPSSEILRALRSACQQLPYAPREAMPIAPLRENAELYPDPKCQNDLEKREYRLLVPQ
jgi:hypothetical protein